MKNSLSIKYNSKLLKIISLFCAFIPLFLVTGPFLPDLVISILSVWFLYYTLKHKIYYIYRNIYFYFFIGFCLACILSSLLSDNILFSLKSSLFYVRIGIFSLLIFFLIDYNKKIIDYFFYVLIITFSFLIIDGFFQYFTGFNLFGYPIISSRISSFFGDELILGSYLSRLFPLLLALFFIKNFKNFFSYFFFSILCISTYILVLLSGERASFFFINLFIIFITIFVKKYKFLKIIILLFCFFLVSLFIFFDQQLYNRFISSPINTIGFKAEKKYLFTPEHDVLLKSGWNMFLDRPVIGQGPKNFRFKCIDPKFKFNNTQCSNIHPHNFYIQLLAETGLMGFLFLFGFFCHFIYLVIKHIFEYFIHKKNFLSDYQIYLLGGVLVTIWPLTTNGNFFTNYLMILYGLQIGFFRKKI